MRITTKGIGLDSGLGEINPFDNKTWAATTAAFSRLGTMVSSAANTIGNGISTVANAIGNGINTVATGLSDFTGNVVLPIMPFSGKSDSTTYSYEAMPAEQPKGQQIVLENGLGIREPC